MTGPNHLRGDRAGSRACPGHFSRNGPRTGPIPWASPPWARVDSQSDQCRGSTRSMERRSSISSPLSALRPGGRPHSGVGGQADDASDLRAAVVCGARRNCRDAAMTTVARHYDEHLGPIYSWMLGDFDWRSKGRGQSCARLSPNARPCTAIDLQRRRRPLLNPLAELGYTMIAVDDCARLIEEQRRWRNTRSNLSTHGILPAALPPSLRTYTLHVATPWRTASPGGGGSALLRDAAAALAPGGLFVATFPRLCLDTTARRDALHSRPQRREARHRRASSKVSRETVIVHDIVHERRSPLNWKLRVSSCGFDRSR